MTVREVRDERSCSMSAACEASLMASESAPEAFSAKFSARRASAVPNADAWCEYRLRAPTGLPSAFSGRARHDRIPCEAAWASNSGQRALSAVSSMRTMLPSRMACRQGPSSSSYCTSSTRAATWSLHATVTGLPLGCMVIPHDSPPPTRRAAITAISCRNCSTLWVLSNAPCSSLRFAVSGASSPCSVVMAFAFVSVWIPYPWPVRQTWPGEPGAGHGHRRRHRPRSARRVPPTAYVHDQYVELVLIAECYQIRTSRTVWHVTDGAEPYDHRDAVGRRCLARRRPAGRGSRATPQCLMEQE